MSQLRFSAFSGRRPLSAFLSVPDKVESVYSLTQHVWAGSNEEERRESKKNNKVRLETLDELFIDPVRGYLNRIFEKIALGEGQGFWVQAEFGVGKSHLLAATAVLSVGGPDAWDKARTGEDKEKKAGPGARIDNLWRGKIQSKRIFPVVFSLEGCGGGQERKLEDFILEEAQKTFALREGKPLAIYPEEHLARLFLKEHRKAFQDDLRSFLADKRLMRGLARFEYDELIEALARPEAQRDAGRVLMAFYRYKGLKPDVPTERGERISRATRDVLESGYNGIFIAVDEMSEYLRRSQFTADDEDCLLALSSSLAKAQGLPIWTLVAAQSAHTNPMKIIGPDRLREELLEHKAERFRDIVIQRSRTITDIKQVEAYYAGYRNLLPWVKAAAKEEFEASFPFPPDALSVLRSISTKLTGTRSTISFLHKALKNAINNKADELVPLWKVSDDLMSYNETPSTSSSGAISIRSRFRGEVAALEAAQATLKRITDGQIARPQNRSRAERILITLFLYNLAGVAGLTREQVLDAVCDLKPGEDELEAQLGHYGTILDEMRKKLSQIRFRQGRYEFVPKETGQYDELVFQATERLKADAQLLWQKIDHLMSFSDPEAESPFSKLVSEEDGRRIQFKLDKWHGQERTGRVTTADLRRVSVDSFEVETNGGEDDFLVIITRRPMTDKEADQFLKKEKPADPRIVVWAAAEPTEEERSELAGVLAHLLVAEENRDTLFEKEGRRGFKRDAHRAYGAMAGLYARGVAKTSRTSLTISSLGGPEGSVAKMASEALDTCYRSRNIDFGNRKFDTQGAVKLINGLVKRGTAVNEGDQLWSAVENFAEPLGLVRKGTLDKLDPGGSSFYREIRAKVEKHGGAGIEIRTVYNWFTGYDPNDGKESAGFTRRMVDVYLLALAQQGVIRISRRKHGDWIDRSTIGTIDFKPEDLRGLVRIELPRALDNWQILYPYVEVQVGLSDGSLGPQYDKASAEEALRSLREQHWPAYTDIQRVDSDIRGLFTALEMADRNPFDDLLLYWVAAAVEPRPKVFDEKEVFDAFCRGLFAATDVKEAGELTSDHLVTFRSNHRRLKELQESFAKTSLLLLRAAKLARAPLPEGPDFKAIREAQRELLKELQNAADLILSPDSVNTRLEPRLQVLEELYVPTYLDKLIELEGLQNEMEEYSELVRQSDELKSLTDFAQDISEAKDIMKECRASFSSLPERLRRKPESRDAAEIEVRREGRVKDTIRNEELTFSRLVSECNLRRGSIEKLKDSAAQALKSFAAFLRSTGVMTRLQTIDPPSKILKLIIASTSDEQASNVLLKASDEERKAFAKQLNAVLGGKIAKTVRIGSFRPSQEIVWEAVDLDRVAQEFRDYLQGYWDKDSYLRLES